MSELTTYRCRPEKEAAEYARELIESFKVNRYALKHIELLRRQGLFMPFSYIYLQYLDDVEKEIQKL